MTEFTRSCRHRRTVTWNRHRYKASTCAQSTPPTILLQYTAAAAAAAGVKVIDDCQYMES